MARRKMQLGEESPKASINKENIKEALVIFRYLKPYKGIFITGLVFIALSSGTTMAFPYLLKKLIDSAHTVNQMYGFTITPGKIALTMICVLSLQMIFSFLRIYLFTTVGENAVADLRKDIYARLIKMPIDFFAQHRVGELSSRITADVTQIQSAVTTILAEFIRGILTLIIGISLIFVISPKMTLLMLSIIPVIIVVALVFSKRIRKVSKQEQDQLADSGIVVQETLQGISNVKAFSNEWYEINRYNDSISKMVKLAVSNGRLTGFFVSFMLFSVFGAIVMVVWYGAGLMQQGLLSFGDLTAFVVYTAFVGGSMAGFADLYSQLQKTLGATQRVRELLNEPIEDISLRDTTKNELKLSGNVSLKHVAFHYPNRNDMPVLRDISIDVKSGEQVAIVGASGAGKSTIISLLLRFYEPISGEICFDEIESSNIPLSALRNQMALVPQDILLFGGTIFENIAYGAPGATYEEVIEAAKQANAYDFIMSFPEQFNTVVGERGMKLSGGQRQRFAIARAILKNPSILLLDEATSALDSESEALVQDALNNLMKNRTSFVVAHRLSTIRNADKIIVLEGGYIKEAGSHAELMNIADGIYKNMTLMQSNIVE